ncbi:MAG: hypothetical protein AAFQ89_10170 [Cyanobacteria bacterium J06626_18]
MSTSQRERQKSQRRLAERMVEQQVERDRRMADHGSIDQQLAAITSRPWRTANPCSGGVGPSGKDAQSAPRL